MALVSPPPLTVRDGTCVFLETLAEIIRDNPQNVCKASLPFWCHQFPWKNLLGNLFILIAYLLSQHLGQRSSHLSPQLPLFCSWFFRKLYGRG